MSLATQDLIIFDKLFKYPNIEETTFSNEVIEAYKYYYAKKGKIKNLDFLIIFTFFSL